MTSPQKAIKTLQFKRFSKQDVILGLRWLASIVFFFLALIKTQGMMKVGLAPYREFVEVLDEELVLFNDYGVNSIMSIIGNYIDKNTILSNYDEMRINEIMADLGDELANFIYCNYEKMGMDSNFKKTRFQLTVLTILHAIESTYRRALRGKTMEDLNSSRIFTQSDNLGRSPTAPQKKKFSPFHPSTW